MIRKAKISDAKDIYRLISYWAKKRKVLERPLNYVYEHLRDFWVCVEDKRVVGACALCVVGWQELGEIKSLVIDKNFLKKSVGKKLVDKCLIEAKELGLKKVFALTFVPEFFQKLRFKLISTRKLPHKIWNECVNCLCFPDCKEQAVLYEIK